MGYCMHVHDSDFRMKAENKAPALAAILAAQELTRTDSLDGAMQEWCQWSLETDRETGAVLGVYFEGEKYRDDDQMMRALGPFVEAGCFVEMRGEDGSLWRWVFDGEGCQEINAYIVWDPEIAHEAQLLEEAKARKNA